MANTLQVDIVTPDRSLFSGRADMVTLPGSLGQMGILPGHAPLLSTLDIGEIILHIGNGSQFVAVSGGVVEVRPDKVTILADTAETPEDIDAARAQDALARAEQLLATMQRRLERGGSNQAMTRDVGLPLARALWNFGRRDFGGAVTLLRPLRSVAQRFGGSHAQRDLVDLTLLEAARRDGQAALLRALAHERLSVKPESPQARRYLDAAADLRGAA